MAKTYILSGEALLARADRAIADAVATHAEVQVGLIAAGLRRPCRPWAGDLRPAKPELPSLPSLEAFLEPWWSVARSMNAVHGIIREADAELERALHRVLPTVETPLALLRR